MFFLLYFLSKLSRLVSSVLACHSKILSCEGPPVGKASNIIHQYAVFNKKNLLHKERQFPHVFFLNSCTLKIFFFKKFYCPPFHVTYVYIKTKCKLSKFCRLYCPACLSPEWRRFRVCPSLWALFKFL